MLQRLISSWMYGDVLTAILLLSLSPLLLAGSPMPLAAPFRLLPPTMVHRYEEHDQDRCVCSSTRPSAKDSMFFRH